MKKKLKKGKMKMKNFEFFWNMVKTYKFHIFTFNSDLHHFFIFNGTIQKLMIWYQYFIFHFIITNRKSERIWIKNKCHLIHIICNDFWRKSKFRTKKFDPFQLCTYIIIICISARKFRKLRWSNFLYVYLICIFLIVIHY